MKKTISLTIIGGANEVGGNIVLLEAIAIPQNIWVRGSKTMDSDIMFTYKSYYYFHV